MVNTANTQQTPATANAPAPATQNANVCNTTKQITQTHFNNLPQQQQLQFITNGYKIVSKITAPQPIQYYNNTPNGSNFVFTCPQQFTTAIKNNPVILQQLITQMPNITFTKQQLIMPKKSGGNNGRNITKYPIPSTDPEKMFVKLNPQYCCNGNKKNGKCIWLNVKNGYCSKCNKNNPALQNQTQIIANAKTAYKTFKQNYPTFINNYYVNGVFNQTLYNQNPPATTTPNNTPPPTPPTTPPLTPVLTITTAPLTPLSSTNTTPNNTPPPTPPTTPPTTPKLKPKRKYNKKQK